MKLTEKESKALDNRAELKTRGVQDHSDCEDCLEEYIFQMQDKYHEFSIGLTTVLSCLAFAQQQGAVPPLPEDWWIEINNRYQ